MSQIFAISTLIKQMEHLCEGWVSDENANFTTKGFLKPEYSDSQFSVQICLNSEFIVELENNFFPQVELHICKIFTEAEPSGEQVANDEAFSITDVLNGWYDYNWFIENIDHSQVITLALELTNKIREALSIFKLSEFNEEPRNCWLIY